MLVAVRWFVVMPSIELVASVGWGVIVAAALVSRN